jgi:hypothetical protein
MERRSVRRQSDQICISRSVSPGPRRSQPFASAPMILAPVLRRDSPRYQSRTFVAHSHLPSTMSE